MEIYYDFTTRNNGNVYEWRLKWTIALTGGNLPGSTFTALTVEGVPVTYYVISESICRVGNGETVAIPKATEGCVTIPEMVNGLSVSGIATSAFEYCTKITKVIIPHSVTAIGDNAFISCRSLECVELGNAVRSLGDYAFESCPLKSISLPNSMEYIDKMALYDCSFNEVTLPSSLQRLGQYCLWSRKLTKIISKMESPLSLSNDSFSDTTYENATLYVPKGAKVKYQSAAYWKKFKNIEEEVEVTSITLNKTMLSLQTNQEETLTATVMPDKALDKTVVWSSSNTSVATVDDNGKVTAISAGTATITCNAKDGSNVKATCEVTVTQTQAYAVLSNDGKTVTFYYDNMKESRGGADIRSSHHGTATIAVFDASFANYRPTSTAYWFSGCSELTTIKGMENLYTDDVTDMEFMFYNCNNLTNLNIKGFNTEKVTSMYGMFCRCLSLEKLDVSGFKMDNVTNTNRMFASCNRLTTLELSNFNTSNVKDMTRMFGSCKSLTTVYVNEKKWNTANVTEGDGVFADCTVLVGGNGTKFDETHTDVEYARIDKAGSPGYLTDIADSKVTGITLNKTKLALQTNQAETLTATVMPDNALDKTVTWSSSNTSVATVDDNGKVTAVSAGTATITCTANGGSNVKATCEVTVTNPKPEKITLPAEATVKAGETTTLTPTMTPENAEATLTWTSDDETVATVDANGVVKGIKKGQTFINVTTDNGKYGWCKVTVTAAEPTAISLPSTMTVYVGGTVSLIPTLTPADAETVLTWMSYDETIATVDGNGIVSGLKEGLTVITATTANGISSNPCKLTVKPDPTGIISVRTARINTPVYSPFGQKLKAPQKGVNIFGGKKIIVK